MQTCLKCNTEKPVYDFYPAQKSECKECTKIRVRNNYRNNIDHYKQYEKERAHLPHRMKLRNLTNESIKYCVIPCNHKAFPSMDHRASWIIKNPKKNKASTKINTAIAAGKITKLPCTWCGTDKNVQGHHPDYSKPLDVIWLCAKHHKAVHHGKIKVYG